MTMPASHLRGIYVAGACLLSSVHPTAAAVVDAASEGFTVQVTAHISAPPDKVYAALITPGRWWNPDHTFSRNAANLSLDAKAGGCWCEKLPDGGTAMHLTVVYAAPGKMLRLRGALGPFQTYGVDGAMAWALKSADGATDLSLTYALGGYHKGGFAEWSTGADEVLTDQVARLKRFIENGSPDKH